MDNELIEKITNIGTSIGMGECIEYLTFDIPTIITLVSAHNHEEVKKALKNIYIEDNYSDHIKHGFEMARGEALRAADNVFNTTLDTEVK